MVRLHDDERKAVESAMKDYEDKLNALVASKEEEAGRRVEIQEANRELRLTIDKLRHQNETFQGQVLQLQRAKDQEISALKLAVKDAQKDLRDKDRVLARKSKEADDLRSNLEGTTSNAERKHLDDMTMLQRRAFEADRLTKEIEESSLVQEKRSQMVIDQIKERSEAQVVNLQAQLQASTDAQRGLQEQLKGLKLKVEAFADERNVHLDVIENAKATIEKLENQVTSSNAAVADLSRQLTDSYAAREQQQQQQQPRTSQGSPGNQNDDESSEIVDESSDFEIEDD